MLYVPLWIKNNISEIDMKISMELKLQGDKKAVREKSQNTP